MFTHIQRLGCTEKYRPDIDGLRAIAVMSVVLYHAGVKALGGGYLGVASTSSMSKCFQSTICECDSRNSTLTEFLSLLLLQPAILTTASRFRSKGRTQKQNAHTA